MMRRLIGLIGILLLLALPLIAQPVVIDFFGEQGCVDCEAVKKEILPQLQHAGQIEIRFHDINEKTNYLKLVHFQEELGISGDENVCLVVNEKYALNGIAVIKTGLLARVKACLDEKPQENNQTPSPIIPNENTLQKRASSWTSWLVAGAGLIDGLNPCAISTLVFFMSLLVVAQIQGRKLIMMGAFFCLGSFIAYFLLGFGLLHVVHSSSAFPVVRKIIEGVMVGLLVTMAGLSFRDAWKYHRSKNPNDVALQLPDRIKRLTHRIMKSGLSMGSIIMGGFIIGGLVTGLESVCTGQTYIPTLVLILKDNTLDLHAWRLLVLYNLMFIVPLVAAFILAYQGIGTQKFIQWSKKNVVIGKVSLGALFIILAALIGVL